MNSTKKLILFLGLLLPITTYAIDKLISSPTGNLILDANTGAKVKVNKDLSVITGNVTSAASSLTLDATSQISSNKQIQNIFGSSSAPAYSFTGDTNTGFYRSNIDEVRIATGGTDWLTILSSGYVGVGTTSPLYNLDVVGSLNISTGNTYKINGTNVLSSTTLGSGVTNSSLTSVGTLTSLTVTNNISSISGTINGDGSGLTSLNAGNIGSGTLPIVRGGTNSATTLNNNRIIQSSGSAIVEASAITANRALISDSNGIPTHSATTNTQVGYLSSATGTTGTGNIVLNNGPNFSGNSTGTITSGKYDVTVICITCVGTATMKGQWLRIGTEVIVFFMTTSYNISTAGYATISLPLAGSFSNVYDIAGYWNGNPIVYNPSYTGVGYIYLSYSISGSMVGITGSFMYGAS